MWRRDTPPGGLPGVASDCTFSGDYLDYGSGPMCKNVERVLEEALKRCGRQLITLKHTRSASTSASNLTLLMTEPNGGREPSPLIEALHFPADGSLQAGAR